MDIMPNVLLRLEWQIINEIRIAEEHRNFTRIINLRERLHTIKTLLKYSKEENDEFGDFVFDITKPL